jgi:hypothetical protein
MPTRFYFPGASPPSVSISPTYDAGWEQTGEAIRTKLVRKNDWIETSATTSARTIPITTTQDILNYQLISEPMRAQYFSGTISLVVGCSTNDITTACTLSVVAKIFSNDGSTSRGTLYSVFGTGANFPVDAAPETRIVNAQTVTPITCETGDRIVVEVGIRATAPAVAGTAIERRITARATADFALTAGLLTLLNPWVEFSQDVYGTRLISSKNLRPYPFSPGLAR